MKREKGFSLLEILVAVGILATSFIALMSLQGGSFLASERGEQLTVATFLARQKMTDVEMKINDDLDRGKFPDEEEASEPFPSPFDDYRWKYAIRKVEIPVVDSGDQKKTDIEASYMQTVMDQISKAVREVKVTVYWGDKDKPEAEQAQMTVTTHVVKLK